MPYTKSLLMKADEDFILLFWLILMSLAACSPTKKPAIAEDLSCQQTTAAYLQELSLYLSEPQEGNVYAFNSHLIELPSQFDTMTWVLEELRDTFYYIDSTSARYFIFGKRLKKLEPDSWPCAIKQSYFLAHFPAPTMRVLNDRRFIYYFNPPDGKACYNKKGDNWLSKYGECSTILFIKFDNQYFLKSIHRLAFFP
jgi:hypothetical protein